MKQIIIIMLLAVLGLGSCHDVTVRYLEAENAQYAPDSMVVRINPDPMLDAVRIKYEAPWVSTKIQGVIGTAPIKYRIIDVKSPDTKDAELMKEISSIDGAGVIYVPFHHNLSAGRYIFSIEVYNIGYSQMHTDIFTVHVE